jgi:hypothetical protein
VSLLPSEPERAADRLRSAQEKLQQPVLQEVLAIFDGVKLKISNQQQLDEAANKDQQIGNQVCRNRYWERSDSDRQLHSEARALEIGLDAKRLSCEKSSICKRLIWRCGVCRNAKHVDITQKISHSRRVSVSGKNCRIPVLSFFAARTFLRWMARSANHNLIVLNAGASLREQLKRKPCRVYPSDLKLRIEATGLYTYPGSFRGLRRAKTGNRFEYVLFESGGVGQKFFPNPRKRTIVGRGFSTIERFRV